MPALSIVANLLLLSKDYACATNGGVGKKPVIIGHGWLTKLHRTMAQTQNEWVFILFHEIRGQDNSLSGIH